MVSLLGSYRTLIADPPWPYDSDRAMPVREELTHHEYGGNVSSRERYGSMTIAELLALSVAQRVCCSNAHLYLWTTNAFMTEAHTIARAWGFKPKTILTWVKVKADGTPSMKTGYYYRGATEHCIFAVRGSLKLYGPPRPTAFLSSRLPHSVKPDWFYELVKEQSFDPCLELFARRVRVGFDAWGNEVGGIDG